MQGKPKRGARKEKPARVRPWKSRHVAWLAFAFLFPMMASEGPFFNCLPGYATLFIALLAGAVVGGWSLKYGEDRLGVCPGDGFWFPLPLFALWCGLSLVWTLSHDHSAYLFISISMGCFLFLSLSQECRDRRLSSAILHALVLSTVLISLFALYQFAELRIRVYCQLPPEGVSWDLFLEQAKGFRPSSVFKDANTYGSLLSILFPLNLYLILNTGGRKLRNFFIALFLLNLMGLFCVASRGPAILAALTFLAALAFEMKRKSTFSLSGKRFLLISGLALLLLVILQALFMVVGSRSLLQRFLEVEEMVEHAMASRVSYWLAALRSFGERPWLGSGLNTLQQNIFSHLTPGTYTRFPHNILFQFMAEIGLPGALLFLSVLTLAFWRIKRHLGDPLVFYTCLALLSLVGYALFDITFQCTSVVFLFFILMALLRGHTCRADGESEGSVPANRRLKIAGRVVLLSMILCSLFSLYEAWRVFKVRHSLDKINSMAAFVSPTEIQKGFEKAAGTPHVLIHKVYTDWLMNRYLQTGKEKFLEQGLIQAHALYERGGRNPCQAYQIALANAKAGRLEESERWFRIALADFPSSLTLWRSLLQVLDRSGKEEETLERLNFLLRGVDQVPHFERYYAIDRFLLELMRAGIFERHHNYAMALTHYRNIYRRYATASFVEAYDAIHGKLVRISLPPYLKEVKEKIILLENK